MRTSKNVAWYLAFCATLLLNNPFQTVYSQHRTVAVTIDDLPTIGGRSLEERQYITRNLLGQLKAYQVPAIGFVNEQKLGKPEARPEEIAHLEAWIKAGFELGNHTYSHPSLNRTPLKDFQEEVLQGEKITRPLMEAAGKQLRYFRHPYLHTGLNLEKKESFEAFLTKYKYTVAPVTIDNSEWIYADAYRKVLAKGDTASASAIGEDYIRYMGEVFAFYETFSNEVFKREPAQTLLIHANRLNADYFDELASMIRDRGYSFISLEEALRDPIYQLPNEFTQDGGISWLQRWSITQGNAFRQTPRVPDWVESHR